MKWHVTVTRVLVSCICVVKIALSQPQLQQSAGGVPLPVAPTSPFHSSQDHGLPLPNEPQWNYNEGQGVPLPHTPNHAQHNHQSHGASISSASAQHPSVLTSASLPSSSLGNTGVGLPPVDHSVVVVPFDQTHGVPLPPQGTPEGHGTLLSSAGVPNTPHRGEGGFAIPGFPVSLEGMTTLKPVRNVDGDRDVQHAVGLTSVHNYLQLRTKADHAVKITDVINAQKQV